ncbi:hypothetical protein DM860_005040 [Cuscuta australis]|uniref:Uncharacterized protein n=1 Tax=Cuscuta australis TaxID=267555 RepID=A0A328DRA2_9ASTE|nr:hypothetical protein DM860_005040 [Cuscuta australis]
MLMWNGRQVVAAEDSHSSTPRMPTTWHVEDMCVCGALQRNGIREKNGNENEDEKLVVIVIVVSLVVVAVIAVVVGGGNQNKEEGKGRGDDGEGEEQQERRKDDGEVPQGAKGEALHHKNMRSHAPLLARLVT